MKRYNLLIILCFLFICTNTFAQEDTQFEFEFELVLEEDDNRESGDDNSEDDGNDDDDESDDDGSEDDDDDDESEDDSDEDDDNDDDDDESEDDSDEDDDSDDDDDESEDDSDEDDDSDDDGNKDGDDDDDESKNGDDDDITSSLRAEVILTNTGVPSLADDITFRVHVGTTIPETLPAEYDVEYIVTFEPELSSGNIKNFSISIPNSSLQAGIDNIVTIWPLVEGEEDDDFREENPNPSYYYQMIFVPPNQNKEEHLLIPEVNLYPNPTNGVVQIEILNNDTANQITIYNTSGQSIKTFKRTSDLTTLNLKDLSQGIYFVAIKNDGGQIIHYSKLIFHK